jgi:membrane protease YdiL (CAAX protease family)
MTGDPSGSQPLEGGSRPEGSPPGESPPDRPYADPAPDAGPVPLRTSDDGPRPVPHAEPTDVPPPDAGSVGRQLPPLPSITPPLARYGSWPMVLGAFLGVYVVAFVLTLALTSLLSSVGVISGGAAELMGEGWFVFLVILISDVALVGVVWALLVRRGVLTWRQMGLSGGLSAHALLSGVAWGFGFTAVATALTVLLGLVGVAQDQADQFPLEGAATVWRLAIWFAGVVIVPVAEEIFFRGFVFRAMSARKGLARGLVYSSMIFAAAHANLAALLPLTAGAVLLAYGYSRSRDLWVPIVAHAFNNGLALTALLLSTR